MVKYHKKYHKTKKSLNKLYAVVTNFSIFSKYNPTYSTIEHNPRAKVKFSETEFS